jgi:TM2 domain-containing membrane protein YozV
MAKVIEILPELQGEEMIYLQNILKDMDDVKARNFANVYRARRREPMLILVTALIGFVGFAGIHRFLMNQMGMGILYLFTAGLCFIGTIVDLVNYQKLAFEYNQKVANEVLVMINA